MSKGGSERFGTMYPLDSYAETCYVEVGMHHVMVELLGVVEGAHSGED